MRTRVTELFGINHPIVLAPMGGVAGGVIAKVPLTDVSASFVMEKLKETTALPLDFAL